MTKDLERDLGLVSVVAISTGAMIGSGIFVLPGIAMNEAGPSVILAFALAAVLVVPAALSIAELGTAMPDAGGDYVFIERGIGPAAGTIAGLGTWLMLMFKGALALVGGMFYLDVLVQLPSHAAAAVVIGTVLILINLFGVKQTGQLQSIMVVVLIVILSVFVIATITRVDGAQYEPFFDDGYSGLIAATTTVLVSYAGVTKIAAVAEEIENPGRNLPLGLFGSLILTAFLYILIVFVLVGVVDPAQLADSNIPMVDAVDAVGWAGVWVLDSAQLLFIAVAAIVLAAILALVSTANAGVLTASRYPLAMSRDDLLPDQFAHVHSRFRTPTTAILVTGGAMLFIIVALPVEDIAKTAGAFQILVYALVCASLIAFRERPLEWYDPDFHAPGYPWVQIFGIVSGLYIISQMDLLPQVGAVGITVFGLAWYLWYARGRVDREGVAVDAARRQAGRQFVAETETRLDDDTADGEEILIALRQDASRLEENRLLQVAAPVAQTRGSRIRVVRFDEVPDQYPLDQATGQTPSDIEFEERTDDLADQYDVDIEVGEIVSHDTKHAVVNYAERRGVDLIVTRSDPVSRLRTLFGRDSDWIMEHSPCDVVFVQPGAFDSLSELAIVTDRSPFNDPLKVELADAIAGVAGANLRFVFVAGDDPSEQYLETIQDYHDELDNRCYAPVEGVVVESDDTDDLVESLANADMVMLSTVTHRRLPDLLFTQRADRVAARLDQPVMLVHSQKSRRTTFLEPIIDRVLFRS